MYADEAEGAAVAVAERRGVWTTVVLAGEDGFSALCITDDAVHLFSNGMIGSVGKPADHTTPGPRELIATDLGTGSMDAGEISLAAGAAGGRRCGGRLQEPFLPTLLPARRRNLPGQSEKDLIGSPQCSAGVEDFDYGHRAVVDKTAAINAGMADREQRRRGAGGNRG